MSRIGKNPVAIPAGVTVDVNENIVTVKGKLGELTQEYSDVTIKVDSLQKIGYVVFFEKVKKNTSNDSLTNDLYKKKIRKIT